MESPGTRVTAERPCCLTGSREAVLVADKAREGHALRNVICRESGLIYVDPLPIEDLGRYYKEDYRKSYKKVTVPKRKHILRAAWVALSRLGHSKGAIEPGARCLDIGAGGGEWLHLLASRGHEVRGVEPNRGYGGFAREAYGLEVFSGMFQEADFERESFDVLTLFQVLEHLADPVEDLRTMSAYLKPGGIFLIEVPDILYPGMRFPHKWHDGHLHGFSAKTLEAVAAKAGLRARTVDVKPGNLFGIFEKPQDGTGVPLPDLEGHCEEALARLLEGKKRYWRHASTYTKTGRRLRKAVGEGLLSLRYGKGGGSIGGAKEMLDAVYGVEISTPVEQRSILDAVYGSR